MKIITKKQSKIYINLFQMGSRIWKDGKEYLFISTDGDNAFLISLTDGNRWISFPVRFHSFPYLSLANITDIIGKEKLCNFSVKFSGKDISLNDLKEDEHGFYFEGYKEESISFNVGAGSKVYFKGSDKEYELIADVYHSRHTMALVTNGRTAFNSAPPFSVSVKDYKNLSVSELKEIIASAFPDEWYVVEGTNKYKMTDLKD